VSKINKIVIVVSSWSFILFTYIDDARSNTNQIKLNKKRITSLFKDDSEYRKVVINSAIECKQYMSDQINSSIHKTYAHY